MIIAVIGLGSMGKRRVRLLERVKNEGLYDVIVAGIDSNEGRRKEAEELYSIKTYASLGEMLKEIKPDATVISTSPLSHAAIIKECLKNDLHVFTEINLVADGYEDNVAEARDRNRVLFLSSTPMYRKEIQYISGWIGGNFNGIYHYHIGQYLPEWHPWENYKNFFVGDKRSNACRELFAIELPWLCDTFGEVVAFNSMHNKVSKLELPYDDCYVVTLEHASGVMGNITIDVVTPKGGREFELWTEGRYLEWKGTPDTLAEYDAQEKTLRKIELYDKYEQNENYNKFVIEDAYYDELVNFMQVIQGTGTARHTFVKDLKVLSLIDKIEE